MTKSATVQPPRVDVSDAVAADVLRKCLRRCCLCYFLDQERSLQEGQLAHIDRDRTDSGEANLVFLCLRHHNLYDTRYRTTKSFMPTEVRHYKKALHRALGTEQQYEIRITGNIEDLSEAEKQRILGALRSIVGADITLKGLFPGSVILRLESSSAAMNAIKDRFEDGTLNELLGVTVLSIQEAPDVDKLLKLADDLIEARQYHNAVACINTAIEADADNANAWALKATALSGQHLFEGSANDDQELMELALCCTTRAIDLSPNSAPLLAHHAAVLYELDQQDEALRSASGAIDIDKDCGLAWYNYGVILYNLGHDVEAIIALESSLKLGYQKAMHALDGARQKVRRLR